MTSPFKTCKSLKSTIANIRSLEFYTSDIYPKKEFQRYIDDAKDDWRIKPPKTIFIPTK